MKCNCVDIGFVVGLYFCPISELTLRACKNYLCTECGNDIKIGDIYKNGVYSRDEESTDSLYFNKMCSTCLSIQNVIFCNGFIFNYLIDDLWDFINNINGEIGSDIMLRLTPKARLYVINLIDKHWESD